MRYHVYQFSEKTDKYDSLVPNLPKNGFWGQNSRNLSLDLESASLRYYVHQFSDKQLWIFGPKFSQKWILGRDFKILIILDLESTPPLYHVCQFSVKMDNIWFFDLNLGKLSNYVQYLGSNFVEGDAESWVEVEMNWEEVYGAGWRWVHSLVIPFDDIFKNLSLVVSYTPVMLHSQWHYWSSSLHKGYLWYKVPSHTISRSWDTSRGTGCILPYPLLPISHVCSL